MNVNAALELKDTGDDNRALFGSAWAFSLNLGPDQLARALANPRGFSVHMRRAINSALKRHLGYAPLFWFFPDVTDCDHRRLHLHGGISCNLNLYAKIVAALIEAGGKWASKKGEAYQLDIKPQTDGDGWVRYALGNWAAVKKILPDDQGAITGLLRRKAKALYKETRAAVE